MLDPDADILDRLARGDTRALADLMARHLSAIKSLTWYMVGDEMMAEDIAQETFIRAWKHAPNWQSGQAKFSTWLHRVAKNLCFDHLRKRKDIYSDKVPERADETPSAQEQMITSETRAHQKQEIDAALAKLPERQHMAVILCHYQNKSQTEAADILEINVRAYESLLARGRRNLRLHLKQHRQANTQSQNEETTGGAQ